MDDRRSVQVRRSPGEGLLDRAPYIIFHFCFAEGYALLGYTEVLLSANEFTEWQTRFRHRRWHAD